MTDEESPARREGGPEAGEGESPPGAPDPVLAERERCLAAVREVLLQGPIPMSLTAAAWLIEKAVRGEGAADG